MAPPQTPFGEFTELICWWRPLTPWLHLRDPTSKRGEGKEREGKRRRKGGSKKEFAPNLHRSMPLGTDSWSDDTDKNFASKPTV